MTRNWMSVTQADLDRAEALFETAQLSRWMETPESEGHRVGQGPSVAGNITFKDVYAYARGDVGLTLDLARALKQQPRLAQDLRRLMARQSHVSFQQKAAASSADDRKWQTEHGVISLHRSRAQSDQVYILIELNREPETPLTRMVVTAQDGRVAEEILTEPVSGVIRVIVRADDESAQLLDSSDCDVYLN